MPTHRCRCQASDPNSPYPPGSDGCAVRNGHVVEAATSERVAELADQLAVASQPRYRERLLTLPEAEALVRTSAEKAAIENSLDHPQLPDRSMRAEALPDKEIRYGNYL